MDVPQPPNQVRYAVALLYASLVLTTVDFLVSATPVEDSLEWFMWGFYAVATVVYGYLIFLVSRRKNWARIVFLIVVAAGTVAGLVWPPEVSGEAWWSLLMFGVSVVADLLAVILLFSGAGHAWFKTSKG